MSGCETQKAESGGVIRDAGYCADYDKDLEEMKVLIETDHLKKPASSMKIRVSRRGMLSAAADAAEERLRSRKGMPSFRIEDLTSFDEEQLADIFPIVNKNARISLSQGIVYAETSASVDPIPLFEVRSPALYIFNQFNGLQPMSEILPKVAEHTGWDEERTRETVRTVFLKLCEVRVCEPGNPD